MAFWSGLGWLCVYFIVCASTAVLLRIFTKIPDEVFRKTLHMILLGSLAVWLRVYEVWWMAAAACLLFAAVVYPLLALAERWQGYSHLLTERKGGEIKNSLLVVFTMFAVVIAVCWGWLDDRLLALAAVFAWGLGDAAAALIGKRFGRHHLEGPHIEGKKSVEGTAAMFVVAFVSVLGVLLLRGGLSAWVCVVISVVTALVTALTELFTKGGYDTITCPLAALAVLLPLVYVFGGMG